MHEPWVEYNSPSYSESKVGDERRGVALHTACELLEKKKERPRKTLAFAYRW